MIYEGKPRECDEHFLGFFVLGGSLVYFCILLGSLALGIA